MSLISLCHHWSVALERHYPRACRGAAVLRALLNHGRQSLESEFRYLGYGLQALLLWRLLLLVLRLQDCGQSLVPLSLFVTRIVLLLLLAVVFAIASLGKLVSSFPLGRLVQIVWRGQILAQCRNGKISTRRLHIEGCYRRALSQFTVLAQLVRSRLLLHR